MISKPRPLGHLRDISEQGGEIGRMGSVCSCLLADDIEEYLHSSGSVLRNCICLGCLAQQLINVYTALFQGEVRAVTASSSSQYTASQELSLDDFVPDTHHTPPTPTPHGDPRFSLPPQVGLIASHDKFFGHICEESQPFRSNVNQEAEALTDSNCELNFGRRSKLCRPESSLKNSAGAGKEVTFTFPSSEDEDVCPTCLEEYTSEDPKIIMQCSHHFHLACIYEWMERSEVCPVCSKVMVFKEAT